MPFAMKKKDFQFLLKEILILEGKENIKFTKRALEVL